jgi:hypothetical protein
MDEVPLVERLQLALRSPLDSFDSRSTLLTLLDVHALHLAPLDQLDGAEDWQHDPRVSALKRSLEARFRSRLDDRAAEQWDDAGEALRQLAREEPVPPIYDWLAAEATLDELVDFVALEGGPDADFDDLVALCQVGLAGLPKITLGANYWDEMGRGAPERVHTHLHDRMVRALGIHAVPPSQLPLEALERKVLNGYLATNRSLQPELLGSLGLIECQAGPRCRRVVTALQRLEAPPDALAFYEEHSSVDPEHGREWIEDAVVPLTAANPGWHRRIARGAAWRAAVNRRFFAAMDRRFRFAARAA